MVTEKRKSVQEIRELLADSEKLADEFRAEKRRLQDRFKFIDSQLAILTGGSLYRPHHGLINRLKENLQTAIYREKDAAGIKIVWVQGYSPYYSKNRFYVLEKVTAKRITIRLSDTQSCDYFHLNGSRFGSWRCKEQIDIRATFGIDADSVPPNWKPPT